MKTFWSVLLVVLLCSTAMAQEVYYVNPEGGQKYHASRECPSIHSKYRGGMVEVGKEELQDEPYAGLLACQVCGTNAHETDAMLIVHPGDYVIGVDLPQGLYSFDCAGNADELVITKWNGDEYHRYDGIIANSEVFHLYNEYQVHVPQGFEGRFLMKMNESELDTGTRQLQLNVPGTYGTYSDFNPGLYIVDALEQPADPVEIYEKADKRVLRRFSLGKGAEYVVYLGSSMEIKLPQGCRLRSFAREMHFQSGEPVLVEQARYLSYQQMPGGEYRITAAPGDEAYYSIMSVYNDYPSRRVLQEGESVVINLNDYGTEVFIELVHCIVTYAIADNG